ncbi:hypothetical protein RLOC_00006330, partial [Lonchura striata]
MVCAGHPRGGEDTCK